MSETTAAKANQSIDLAEADASLASVGQPILQITDLGKKFPGRARGEVVTALDGVNLEVAAGEFFTLLGPSGCGKTTTLRCIAGLETPTEGTISVEGRPLYSAKGRVNVVPNKRNLGMVFQSYAIWPHMDVFANVAFPLRARTGKNRLAPAEIKRRVEDSLEKVELGHLRDRRATDLSGGQQQRLALARALIMEAPLTLFDEPLSNLDAKLRDNMRFELKRLQRELGLTAIYVTHDQTEALSMSSRIAVMRQGRVEQLGRPREIYDTPASLFVADFIGTSNFFSGEVTARNADGSYVVRTPAGDLPAKRDGDEVVSIGASVKVSVRPQHVRMEAGAGTADGPRWPGRVMQRAYLGEFVDHMVDVSGTEVRVRATPREALTPGTEVSLSFHEPARLLIEATES